MNAADDFDAIRKRRDELRSNGSSLDDAGGENLDKIGQAYHVYRRPDESDYAYRSRIKAER